MERYLEELLYRHECVIIPGFGGFVSNFSPARINPSTHQFTPPSRILTFNRHLRNNDGLLANHIATAEQVSFAEALAQVRTYVDEMERALNAGDRFSMNRIGSLFSDRDGKIIFAPSEGQSFLPESFGLHSFRFPPIRREELVKKVEKQLKDRLAPEVIEKGVAKRRVRPARVIAMAASFLLLASLVYIPWQTSVMEQQGWADLNPFKGLKPRFYNERTDHFVPPGENEYKEEKVLNYSDTDAFTTMSVEEGSGPVVVRLSENPADPDKTVVKNHGKEKQINRAGRYHLIAGAFAVPQNADNYVIRLSGEGLGAGIMEQQFSSLRYVSVGNFQTREEALAELARIKASHPDVWLLVK